MYDRLGQRIDSRTAHIVQVGLGYVGLPVACMFAARGFRVTGVDLLAERVAILNRGQSPIDGTEPGLDELVRRVVTDGTLRATTDCGVCGQADVVLVAVDTPVERDSHKPAYRALSSALRSIGPNLCAGAMVIIESTIAPGTMDGLVGPIIEETSGLVANEGFCLIHCPERVMPGKLLRNLSSMPRVVGGSSPEAAQVAIRLYSNIVDADLDAVDCLTAEVVKTAENAYRDLQIAFANELALICEDLGADVWNARELINKCPGRNVLYPGAGVGGHCIPKDPWLLVANVSEHTESKLIHAARAVNDSMPLHVADMVVQALSDAQLPIVGARLALLGYAYLEDSDDTRNTPTEAVVQRLRALGAEPRIHDPYVTEYAVPLEEVFCGADCAVVLVRHRQYRDADYGRLKGLMRHPILVDARNAVGDHDGLTYYRLGSANRGTGHGG